MALKTILIGLYKPTKITSTGAPHRCPRYSCAGRVDSRCGASHGVAGYEEGSGFSGNVAFFVLVAALERTSVFLDWYDEFGDSIIQQLICMYIYIYMYPPVN